jgi:peptidoglycan glycosyltransferase
MAACAVVMLAAAATVQAFRADETLARPHLGVQADGGRRYTYNPRVLGALRGVPRGTIYDRAGVPLATNCADSDKRCYPAGASFFHVLGDVNTHANWSAGNSSYVERDAEYLLRGFDDRAPTTGWRNFTPVIPLVRHRWEPDHPDVNAFLARPRDVRLTIDARLQQAVAKSLERVGKGAVVVLDAQTGAILATVSYPFTESDADLAEPTLDRARYALYPPGSTFKLVTAAAALRESETAHDREFTCTRLSPTRIGARLPGFGPPAYDDVKDQHAHGPIRMHDAIVKSCNAYFAQLAIALGSEPLARTAAAAGIQLNTPASPDRVRAHLPHAGYGQGEVVATPLRMARVAAAIATDGAIRETPIVTGQTPSISTSLVSPAAARTLAADLRAAVVSGTGRLLRDHSARIAGKTGTAEVDDAPSHAWFVGFAPHGGARRIAFAVVLENAGYGGQAAARVAGEVASSAASLGIIK